MPTLNKQLWFSQVTFLAVEPRGPKGALAGISVWESDAGGAVGTQRRRAMLDITHGYGLRTQCSLPSKWALATASRPTFRLEKLVHTAISLHYTCLL